MGNSAIDAFNKGKVVKVTEGGNMAEVSKQILKIKTVYIEESSFKSKDGDTQYQFAIECVNNQGDLMKIWQAAKLDGDGNLKNPAYPLFTTKAGETVPQSPIHEIMKAAEVLDKEGYNKKLKETETPDGRNWKEFLEGLKFELDVKVGEKKDGGVYMIPMTDKQKQKEEKQNEEYRAKKGGNNDMVEKAFAEPSTDDLPF